MLCEFEKETGVIVNDLSIIRCPTMFGDEEALISDIEIGLKIPNGSVV